MTTIKRNTGMQASRLVVPSARPATPPPKPKPAVAKAVKPVSLRRLVVIEEGTIASMASNATFLKAFPFLAAVGRTIRSENGKPRGCGGCGRAAQERTAVYTTAKQAIASMDATKKRELREMLNAEQVRLVYKATTGKTIQLTF